MEYPDRADRVSADLAEFHFDPGSRSGSFGLGGKIFAACEAANRVSDQVKGQQAMCEPGARL